MSEIKCEPKKFVIMDIAHVAELVITDEKIVHFVGEKFIGKEMNLLENSDTEVSFFQQQELNLDFRPVFSAGNTQYFEIALKIFKKCYPDVSYDFVVSTLKDAFEFHSPIKLEFFEKDSEKSLMRFYIAPRIIHRLGMKDRRKKIEVE